MQERQVTGVSAPGAQAGGSARLSLDGIDGDWLTVAEFAAWTGVSRNSAYEVLRQDPFRQAVRHFGRQIRVSKKALVRIVEEAS